MAVEPALPTSKQLLDFIVSHPVVLLVVENRNEHVQVRQELVQSTRGSKRDREDPARAERRHALVEFVARRFDRVAERLEQRAEERFAAAAGNRCEPCLERQLCGREVGRPLASAAKCGVEPTRKDDREQRRGDVRPIVDVLILGAALAAAATDHSDRVDIEEALRQQGHDLQVVRSALGRYPTNALWFGVDDLDGTVQEEKIYHMAGARTPESLTTADIRRLIRAAGREPVERDTLYNVITGPEAPDEMAHAVQ